MATGLEIVAIKDGKARLFKVRHDGYAIEDYIDQVKVPQGSTTLEAIKHFKEWFFSPSNYGPEEATEDGQDIETNFPDGYEFTPSSSGMTVDALVDQADQELMDMEDNGTLPNGVSFEGLTCGYSDYVILFDLDTNKFVNQCEEETEE